MPPSSTAPAGLSITARIEAAQAEIAAACRAAGRPADAVVLTAVAKTQPPGAIDQALAASLRVFGENRVQEAAERWRDRRDTPGLELRLIGPLQTNKAGQALALFDVIETVDRPRLVEALARAAGTTGRAPRVLVQVNTGAEPQKGGVLPREAGALIELARARGLSVEGLMCIPPAEETAGLHFALLAKLAARHGLPVLSMGMSGDFAAAVRHGATHVRLGSALFGERKARLEPFSD
jgi:hypothetical protein